MLRPGRRLAIDVGKARIGLAVSDFHGILASPFETVKRLESVQESVSNVLEVSAKIAELIEIYVGIPINLKGQVTASTTDSLVFAEELARQTTTPVFLIDERMTTSLANSQLREIGKSQRDARSTIDQMAAVAILEYALSKERTTGQIPGVSLEQWKDEHE